MTNDIELQNQVEFLYHAAAKQLYNLALYTIGSHTVAEQITIDAFADAFHSISDKSDAVLFKKRSIKLLYRYGRKMQTKVGYDFSCTVLPETAEDVKRGNLEKKHLIAMLGKLCFDERYILLLFCWQRLSIKQIAKTIYLPMFLTKKRLYATVNKAASKFYEI